MLTKLFEQNYSNKNLYKKVKFIRWTLVELKIWATKTFYVANQMSMSDYLKFALVCQQSPSKSLFEFCAVLFGPGEGTICVPIEELL